jgi:hypothetical protein
MNWEAIGAIGEAVGAVAVVASLVYLAVQIRQNTKSVQAATFQSIAEGLADASYRLIDPPPVTQKADWFLLFVGTLRRYENLHFQIRRGTLEPSDVEGFIASLGANAGPAAVGSSIHPLRPSLSRRCYHAMATSRNSARVTSLSCPPSPPLAS